VLTAVNPPGGPTSAVYSQAIEAAGVRRMLFISGQVGVAPDGTVPQGVAAQARLAFEKLNVLLAQAGMTAANVTKWTIYLTDTAHVPEFMASGAVSLPTPPPATTLLIVKGLADPALLIEVEAIAVA
jgi:2-iminobutanoate/2-iminopropanoate deaminase